MKQGENPTQPSLTLLYDGQCPFCSAYARLTQLRATMGEITLIDARISDQPTVQAVKRQGYDLNTGMAVLYGEQAYHGADAVHFLALHSTRQGWFNRLNYWIFRSPARARLCYPFLRLGRNLALCFKKAGAIPS